jgi:hypothetical protein
MRRGTVALEIESSDERMTVHTSWWHVAVIAGTVLAAIFGGYWLLVERVIDGVAASVAELRDDATSRLEGREEEDRDIRSALQESSDKLRAEIKDLGDRLVASNAEVGEKIEGLRGSLLLAVERADGRTERRFDRLEEKLDKLIKDIVFPIEKTRYLMPDIDELMPAAPATVNDPR